MTDRSLLILVLIFHMCFKAQTHLSHTKWQVQSEPEHVYLMVCNLRLMLDGVYSAMMMITKIRGLLNYPMVFSHNSLARPPNELSAPDDYVYE